MTPVSLRFRRSLSLVTEGGNGQNRTPVSIRGWGIIYVYIYIFIYSLVPCRLFRFQATRAHTMKLNRELAELRQALHEKDQLLCDQNYTLQELQGPIDNQ